MGSLFTADVLLSESSDFEGGELHAAAGAADEPTLMRPVALERGDCVVFLSHKAHAVTPLRRGKRVVFVIEFWLECPCVGNHRCMGLPPCSAH
jgi:predicted 2-oxoglutarate/Fe(II)-dependent dioxygenase YbiX